jgi:hypothetical protein
MKSFISFHNPEKDPSKVFLLPARIAGGVHFADEWTSEVRRARWTATNRTRLRRHSSATGAPAALASTGR